MLTDIKRVNKRALITYKTSDTKRVYYCTISELTIYVKKEFMYDYCFPGGRTYKKETIFGIDFIKGLNQLINQVEA